MVSEAGLAGSDSTSCGSVDPSESGAGEANKFVVCEARGGSLVEADCVSVAPEREGESRELPVSDEH